jgi:hypothetical protein
MASIKSLMLGAAMLAGAAAIGSASANAAQIGVYIGAHSEYVPPCPGPGYEWVAGYYDGGYWIPGRWAFAASYGGYGGGYGYDRHHYYRSRDWDRDRYYDRDRHRDRDRHYDRDDHRGWDRDHDRFRR